MRSPRRSDVLNRMSAMLSDRNSKAVSTAMENIQAATTELPPTMQEMRQLVSQLEATTAEITASRSRLRASRRLRPPSEARR